MSCLGIDTVMPVDVYIPGCPPKPEAIIYGIAQLLAKLEGKDTVKIDPSKIRLKTEEKSQEVSTTQ